MVLFIMVGFSTLMEVILSKRFFILSLLLTSFLFCDIPTLEQITKSSPQEWIQKGDRWTFKERFEDKRDEIYPVLDSMGMFETQWASGKHYDYALVLGALHGSVEMRINHIVEEWKRGTRFDQVVFLTGQRPLHLEKEKEFLSLKNETAMMIHVWETTSMPPELRAVPLTIVDAPPLPLRGRPTTESTVYEWLELSPSPGTILMVSSQPYVGYQRAVLNTLLPLFEIEGVGQEGGRTLPISVLLDTLAKEACWTTALSTLRLQID
jgi:hypothetical protein